MPSERDYTPIGLSQLSELLEVRLRTTLFRTPATSRFRDSADSEACVELTADALLSSSGIREAIVHMPRASRSPENDEISGTLLAKSYSLVALAALCTYSLSDRRVSLELSDVALRIDPESGMSVSLLLADEGVSRAEPDERPAQVAELAATLVNDHFAAVYSSIHEHTRARLQTMWALLSTNLRNTYLRIEQQADALRLAAGRRDLLQVDQQLLFSDDLLPGDNPLAQPTRLYEPTSVDAPATYLRNRCCLRYRIRVSDESVPYCLTCPLLSDRDRDRMIAEHLKSETEV